MNDSFPVGAARPKVLALHLELLQYPILSDVIRERLREELFSRGIVDRGTFQHEVREKAIASQRRERLDDPLRQETEEVWQLRLSRIRDIMTEFYFALNFDHSDFTRIVEEVLLGKSEDEKKPFLAINPEIAPWKMLFSQARQIASSSPEVQHERRHYLREILVVLIKGMLSDQLSFVGIAQRALTVEDLEMVYERRIGRGKIGGKAGGMLLARAILHKREEQDPIDFEEIVSIPDSCFLGCDVLYEFLEANDLGDTVNLKYMGHEELVEEYPRIVQRYQQARIPERYREQLRAILDRLEGAPLIVRSSSLLEDNFGISFAGKYDSFFCPNQGTRRQNLEDLSYAIKRVYASLLSPDAVIYRQQKGLIDYDERMGVLIQRVVGQRYGDYFFPTVAGVGFSYNPLQWNPRIDRDAGFLRIVAGLGTRAVDRLPSDYARMVALSHPTLRPVKGVQETVQYAQKQMELINLRENRLEALPVAEVLDDRFPALKQIGSIESEGALHQIMIKGPGTLKGNLVLTYDGLLKNRRFVSTMRALLQKLARHYGKPVDIEFTLELLPKNEFRIHLLQCRQQSRRAEAEEFALPQEIPADDLLLFSKRMVTTGRVSGIRYVVYVDPERYRGLADERLRLQIGREVGRINRALADETFVLVGPGRWGSSNIQLGVPVSYGDIFNASALIEIALPHGGAPPEASYGTHFFQDLIESDIFPLPVYPGEEGAFFNFDFFRSAPSALPAILPHAERRGDLLKIVDLAASEGGCSMEIVMNSRSKEAMGYLTHAPHQPRIAPTTTGEYKIRIGRS